MTNNNYTLPEISFIGGTTQYLTYSVFDQNGNPVDLNGATCKVKFRQYGSFGGSAILDKTGNITGLNNFQIVLDTSDTKDLYGKFVQQAIVIDSGKKEFRYQGIIVIEKAIL